MQSAEAARFLGVSVATVRRWCDAEKLPHWTTPAGQRRFEQAKLEEWLEGRRRAA